MEKYTTIDDYVTEIKTLFDEDEYTQAFDLIKDAGINNLLFYKKKKYLLVKSHLQIKNQIKLIMNTLFLINI
jgi:hypothetical protein